LMLDRPACLEYIQRAHSHRSDAEMPS